MFVSVIIPTYNRSTGLRRVLDLLLCPTNVNTPNWEVIVVDNGSTDQTPDVCREFQKKFPAHFRSIVEKKKGKSNALNAGISAARGDILALTDDDVFCGPDYIQSIHATFAAYPAADGAQTRVLLDCEGGVPPWFEKDFAAFLSLRDYGDKVFEWNDNLSSANMVIHARVPTKIGGFSPALGPGKALGIGQIDVAEDTEFSMRLRRAGFRLIYAPQIVVRHQILGKRLTKAFFRERYFRWGRANAYFDPLTKSLWRWGLYVMKELVVSELSALRHLLNGRAALALRRQCDGRTALGFWWQHYLFQFGKTPRDLAVLPLTTLHGRADAQQ